MCHDTPFRNAKLKEEHITKKDSHKISHYFQQVKRIDLLVIIDKEEVFMIRKHLKIENYNNI